MCASTRTLEPNTARWSDPLECSPPRVLSPPARVNPSFLTRTTKMMLYIVI